MDSSELAMKMLEWEKMKRALDALETEIAAAVLEIGKTQTVGNVRATYSAGRRTYLYEEAGRSASQLIIDAHKIIRYDWKAICEEAGITTILCTETNPSVSVKLLE